MLGCDAAGRQMDQTVPGLRVPDLTGGEAQFGGLQNAS